MSASPAFALQGAVSAPRARYSVRAGRGPVIPRAVATDSVEESDKRKNPSLYDGSVAAAADAKRGEVPSVRTGSMRSDTSPTTTWKTITKPEILAPAGGWPQMRAAVEAGADAVYFGLSDGFNARARATNFDAEELPRVMSFLHERDVKGFVTLNVLVFDEELVMAEDLVRQIAQAGVDAVIVQDVGLVTLIKKVAPNLTIHGSTQMSITSPEGAEFARGLGCKRVVVGRELSVREIASVRNGTECEVEAFVHGALCVSYRYASRRVSQKQPLFTVLLLFENTTAVTFTGNCYNNTNHKWTVLSLTLVTVQTDYLSLLTRPSSNTSRYTVHPHSPTDTLFYPSQRAVFFVRGVGRAEREPRAVRAGVSLTVRTAGGRGFEGNG